MARRHRTSVFEVIIHTISKLPWWLGVLLAVISYVWLHNIAINSTPTLTPDIRNAGNITINQMWHTLATILQYIIPICSLIGACISAYYQVISNRAAKVKLRDESYSANSTTTYHSKTKTTPKCPVCGGAMVERRAKKGINIGESFWGCTSYPKCRGTRTSV